MGPYAFCGNNFLLPPLKTPSKTYIILFTSVNTPSMPTLQIKPRVINSPQLTDQVQEALTTPPDLSTQGVASQAYTGVDIPRVINQDLLC